MCGRHNQRQTLAAALVTGFIEHQAQRHRALPGVEQPSMASTSMPYNTQIRGVTTDAPAYAEHAPVNPNPPSYEEIAGERSPSHRYAEIPDEKPSKYELKGSVASPAPLPPHAHDYDAYSPNTGLEDTHLARHISSSSSNAYEYEHENYPSPNSVAFPQQMPQFPSHIQNPAYPADPLARLLSAISLFYDTKIHLSQDHPAKVRHLEQKKARKLEKASRKFEDKIAKGKDIKYAERLEKRTAKMEKWSDIIVKRYQEHQKRGYGRRGHYAHASPAQGYGIERGYGRRCDSSGYGRRATMV